MSVIPMQPNAPINQRGQQMMDPAMVTDALLRAAENAATKSLTAQGQDCKDFATAALNLAQAVVVLDPQLSQGGTPLEHDIALKSIDHETQARVATIQGQTAVAVEQVRGQNALAQAKETAAAPTPRKRVTVNRENGRMTGMEVEG
jgi:hypothetical protein